MSLASWMDAHASPAWRQWHKLHSSWVSIFWFAFYGALVSMDAFIGTSLVQAHPIGFTLVSMGATVTWGVARMTKQPGTDDVR